jgi:hypothetical protein
MFVCKDVIMKQYIKMLIQHLSNKKYMVNNNINNIVDELLEKHIII